MSGGQQRRVSLACSLIHCPPLLILDEPTVGTDPVLRRNIWSHLVKLSISGHTIIVTTHYIDEARKAHTVAFMRNGRLVAQENPDVLLNQYGMLNLEDVFLKLCIESEEECINNNNDNSDLESIQLITDSTHFQILPKIVNKQNESQTNDMFVKISMPEKRSCSNDVLIKVRSSGFFNKLSALLQKDFKRFTRKWPHLILYFLTPTLMFTFTMLSIGDGPINMNLAIFDEEKHNNLTQKWGQLFLNCLERDRFILHYFETLEEAIESVKLGHNHAAIEINERFTIASMLRLYYLTETNEDTLGESMINVYIDQSNQVIALQVKSFLYLAMTKFSRVIALKVDIKHEFFEVPLNFDETIYEDSKGSIKEFVLPGFYLASVCYNAAVMTGHNIIVERKDGIFQRSIVAGITASDILSSNIIFQMLVQVFQMTLLLSTAYFMLHIRFTGSFLYFISMIFSQGLCGIGLGLMIAILMSDELIATLLLILLFVITLTTGVFWPIENMPQFMQYFVWFFPNTVPIYSMRNIMYRDWGIEYFEVYFGFIVSYIWFSMFLIIALILLKKGF